MAKKAVKTTEDEPSLLGARAGKPLRVVLLDSHAILHRAYHALPDFSSSTGAPTGALYGLVLMILKIQEVLKPDYIVATRDLPGKTFRHDKYEAYKGTRVQIEDALITQLEQAPRVFESFGVPVYQLPGYEADDMVGSIVKQLKDTRGVEVVIATGDKDLLQLISPHVSVYRLRKGLNDIALSDEKDFQKTYGFAPAQMTDLKGIMGDASDNIKGVPGVGEGSALKLVQTFGALEELYKEIDERGVEDVAKAAGVQKRYVQLVADNKESAFFSRELATIHPDAPIQFALPDHEYDMKNHAETIGAILDELEFRALRERLRGSLGLTAAAVEVVGESDVEVDAARIREVSIALWLLKSDMTNPTIQDILSYAKTKDFDAASKRIFKELHDTGRLEEVYEQIEKPLIPVVDRMNQAGILLDVKYLSSLEREYASELSKIGLRIFKHAGHEFNINSPKQLGVVLYDELKITPEKQKMTSTGARTTREEELLKLADEHPIIMDILSYRELQKLLSTYIEKMPKLVDDTGRLHTEFVQAGSATGRMACQDPNLQNIPIKTESGKRIRKGFVAPKGFSIVAIDYSQIELRIAAGLSGDKILTGVFKRGEDVHTETAAQVFGVDHTDVTSEMRRRAKVINFGILYGMGANALRANLGSDVSRDDATKFLAEYFKKFSGVAQFIEDTKASALAKGFTETLYGRRRYFPGFASSMPNLRAQAERMAVNAPIQGTQADIIKRAMIEADDLIEKKGWRDRARLLLQVHDELVYEIAEDDVTEIGEAIRLVMESVVSPERLGGVPIIAEMAVGKSWGETERVARSR